MIMKKTISIVLCLLLVLSLTACGGGDALKGTWTCQDKDYGTVTWNFDGNGKCTLKHDFTDDNGTYTIDGSKVSIKLSLWDTETVYDFTASGSGLKLTATDGLAPDYDLAKK